MYKNDIDAEARKIIHIYIYIYILESSAILVFAKQGVGV